MTEQELRKVVVFGMEKLLESDVGHRLIFTLPGDQNDGFLWLQEGYMLNESICFSTGAVAKGDDHIVQHFLHYTANMEEMSAWLRDAKNVDGVIDSLKQLGDRVDNGFD